MATAVKPTTVRVDENLKAQANELGLIPDDAPAFDDIDGLVAFLEEE